MLNYHCFMPRPGTISLAALLALALAPGPTSAQGTTVAALPGGDPAATTVALQILQEELRRAAPAGVVHAAFAAQVERCGTGCEGLQRTASLQGSRRLYALGIGREGAAFELRLVHLNDDTAAQRRLRLAVSGDGLGVALRGVLGRLADGQTLQAPGTADLLVWPHPPESDLRVEGRWVGTGPILLSGLQPGEVRVQASHELFRTAENGTRVAAGDVKELRIVLRPGGRGLPRPRLAPLVALGAAAGLGALAGSFGLLSGRAQDEFDSGPVNDSTLPGLLDTAERGERWALAANSCWVLAGVAALAAGGLYGAQWWSTRSRAAALAESWQPPPEVEAAAEGPGSTVTPAGQPGTQP